MAARDIILIATLLLAIGLALFIIGFISNKTITVLANTPAVNDTQNVKDALLVYNTKIFPGLDYIFLAVFIGLVISLMASAWFIDAHPIFMAVFIVIIVFGVMMATVLSNTWEIVTSNTVFETNLASYPISNYIILNLPYFLAVIGALGLVVTFGKPRNTFGGGGLEGYQ
jgi:hypothetical protein